MTQPTPTRTPPVPSDGTLGFRRRLAHAARRRGPRTHRGRRGGGLSTAEAEERTRRFGANRFDAAESESRLHAFLRQYADPMQVVLLVAGIGSLYPLKEIGTGILLLLLTVFNAVLGLRQEGKAAAAVAALQKMMIIKARVTRDGQLAQLPAEQLVPGDVVAIEAGDIVPADGRLLRAATLEVAESALTGESLPVSKGTAAVERDGHPARGPQRHGVHEHQRHPRIRRVRRRRDRDGHRGRPHLRDAAVDEGVQDPAHPPARHG